MYDTIQFETQKNKAYITLNRPDVYNALNEKMLKELLDAILHCDENSEIRVVIISGGGSKAFCSGADLKAGISDTNLGNSLRTTYNPLISAMRNLKKPIICKLNGLAVGAGMSLALACDVIIGDENAYLSELFVGIGLIPDAGSMFFLPRLIGPLKTFELCSTGRKIYMEEALALGLVNKIVSHSELNMEIEKIAELYANAATASIGLMKQILNQSFSLKLEDILELEANSQTICGNSEDFIEGVTSFIEKRLPSFKGK